MEIEDQWWCPSVLRDAATDYLTFIFERFGQYRAAGSVIRRLLSESGTRRVIDLCSGAGGPWSSLESHVQLTDEHPVEIALTDRYPNLSARGRVKRECRHVHYVTHPVDATQVAPQLAGVRTMFTAFHHFPPDAARAVLADADARRAPIAIFEVTQRSVPMLLLVALSPILVWLVTPFIRPFSWKRIFFTYPAPLIPLLVVYDGLVSCLRTYGPDELLAMAHEHEDGLEWSSGILRGWHLPLTYLVGVPRHSSDGP